MRQMIEIRFGAVSLCLETDAVPTSLRCRIFGRQTGFPAFARVGIFPEDAQNATPNRILETRSQDGQDAFCGFGADLASPPQRARWTESAILAGAKSALRGPGPSDATAPGTACNTAAITIVRSSADFNIVASNPQVTHATYREYIIVLSANPWPAGMVSPNFKVCSLGRRGSALAPEWIDREAARAFPALPKAPHRLIGGLDMTPIPVGIE
jgi:hypothetical protein